MKEITASVGITFDKMSWSKFVQRLVRFSKHGFASLIVKIDKSSISIQQTSPVPRMQKTIIRFSEGENSVVVDSVTMESADHLRVPDVAELKSDIIHFIQAYLDEK